MMIWSQSMKSWIVTIFLVAIASVYICDFLCNIDVIQFGGQTQPEFIAEASHSHHPHNNAEAHHYHSGDQHAPHPPQDNSSETEGCCDDLIQSLYSSLIKDKIPEFKLEGKYFLVASFVLVSYVFNPKINTFFHQYYYCKDPPPLNGFNIRILIQSFLN